MVDEQDPMGVASTAVDDTARERDSAVADAGVDPGGEGLRALSFGERYEMERPLGEGGMGAVLLFRDRQIGRRVALKVMHPSESEQPRARGASCARPGSRGSSSTRRWSRSTTSASIPRATSTSR